MQRGKPYVEAFPSLSLLGLTKAHRQGRRVTEWTNEHGCVVGNAEVKITGHDEVTIRHQFFGTPNIERSVDSLTIMTTSRKINPVRSVQEFRCPNNGCNVDRLYFVRGYWACRNCHDLVYRIQRLSPSHKQAFTKDADCASRQRRFISMNAPEELRFATNGRWLAEHEVPASVPAVRLSDYGWSAGQPGGFAVFLSADTPPTPATGTPLSRFPSDVQLVGSSLFRGDLVNVLERRFIRLASGVSARLIAADGLHRPRLTALIAEACTISALRVPTTEPRFQQNSGAPGRVRVSATIAYTGDDCLWTAKAAGTIGSERLRAELDDERLVLAAWVDYDDAVRAREVIHLALRLIKAQISVQAEVLGRYDANLIENADRFAGITIARYAKGKPITSERELVER